MTYLSSSRRPVNRRSAIAGAIGLGAAGLGVRRASAGTSSAGRLPAPREARRVFTRPAAVPPAAAAAGFTRLTFDETFMTAHFMDFAGTDAAGYDWYPRAPWWHPSAPRSDYLFLSDATSENFLRLDPSVNNCNWNLSTLDPYTGQGRTFLHGYFEARMRFRPIDEPRWDVRPLPVTWPSFWALDKLAILGRNGPRTVELDFFEAITGRTGFAGVLHETHEPTDHYRSVNAGQQGGVDYATWHRFACLWRPGSVEWYLDDRLIMEQTWGALGVVPMPQIVTSASTSGVPADVFTSLDTTPLALILGTGIGNPLDVDHVRVWQA